MSFDERGARCGTNCRDANGIMRADAEIGTVGRRAPVIHTLHQLTGSEVRPEVVGGSEQSEQLSGTGVTLLYESSQLLPALRRR